ncbi:hypothetical protein ACH42_09385 [Endozoicomonas sp. (ex Bugula neritina AB1)]|nr:hypothetical protein ACH42_09385 [Endozoicomonas sp. (ex Bugula neritina AB1)]
MSEKHARSLQNAISGDKPKALESETGSVNSRLGMPNYHSFCPLCAEQDIENHGVAYWHQLHTLPGVSACHIHKCKLVRSKIRPKILAIPDLNQAEVHKASDNEILFSQLSAKLCQRPTYNYEPATEIIERYKQQLDCAGYISEAGLVRREKLLSDIRSFWSHLLNRPDFLNLRTSGKEHNFVRDVLTAEIKRTHPVKHILLNGFLNHTDQKKTASKSSDITPRISRASGDNHDLVISLLKDGMALSKTTKESGVSYYTVRKLAKVHDIKHKTKPKKMTPEQEHQALELLKTGLSMKKAGEQVGLPESTVDNLLLSHPEIRAARHKLKKTLHSERLNQLRGKALSIIQDNPDMTRKTLTDSYPDIFIWLKNHDKKWLYSHLPKPLTASQAQSHRYKHQQNLWKNKQRNAVKGLRSLVRKMTTSPPQNQRLSISYILKTLKVRNPQSHIRKTMPAFWRQLTRFAETHEDFQLRKLHTLYTESPALFTIYSARRLLKIAAAFPPVSDMVLEQAQELQKSDFYYQRPADLQSLLLRNAHNHSVQMRYYEPCWSRSKANPIKFTIPVSASRTLSERSVVKII